MRRKQPGDEEKNGAQRKQLRHGKDGMAETLTVPGNGMAETLAVPEKGDGGNVGGMEKRAWREC